MEPKQMNGLDVRVATVDAILAAEWLKTNEANRNVSAAVVQRYASDMAAGAWRLNGDSVKFDATGRLIDGQHRLMAIIKSDHAVSMLVIRGLPREVRDTVDCGKGRTIADRLALDGFSDTLRLGARATIIWAIEEDKILNQYAASPTLTALKDILARHREGLEWAGSALRDRKFFGAAPCAGTLAYCYPTAPQEIDEFAKKLVDGTDLGKQSPVYHLREFMIRRDTSGWRARSEACKGTLRALIAALDSETMKQLAPGRIGPDWVKAAVGRFSPAHSKQ